MCPRIRHLPLRLARATHDRAAADARCIPGHTLLKIPIDGGPATVLATDLYSPHAVTSDGTTVSWLDSGVMKVPVNGGKVETIGGENELLDDIAVDATSVYWVSFMGGTVKRLTPK